MDVKPWEPVSYVYGYNGKRVISAEFCAREYNLTERIMNGLGTEGRYHCQVTLANGQRIIIRALSEDRKAARAERSAYKAALEPWMAAGVDAMEGLSEELRVKGYCDGDPSFRPSRRAKEANR